ncbi:MAG: hypothetical protein AAGJ46_17300 [Planctomycetota bacterium]
MALDFKLPYPLQETRYGPPFRVAENLCGAASMICLGHLALRLRPFNRQQCGEVLVVLYHTYTFCSRKAELVAHQFLMHWSDENEPYTDWFWTLWSGCKSMALTYTPMVFCLGCAAFLRDRFLRVAFVMLGMTHLIVTAIAWAGGIHTQLIAIATLIGAAVVCLAAHAIREREGPAAPWARLGVFTAIAALIVEISEVITLLL